jgi:hypothetical protein
VTGDVAKLLLEFRLPPTVTEAVATEVTEDVQGLAVALTASAAVDLETEIGLLEVVIGRVASVNNVSP